MSILGVESAVFGVDDIDTCARFWSDFSLSLIERTDDVRLPALTREDEHAL